jgi:hypothetical protein
VAVAAVTVVGIGASAGVAGAASSFQLSISPTRIAPGKTVTISTTPRQACRLTISIAKKPFSHAMPYGWIQVRIPRKDEAGRVPVKVNCGGHVDTGSFMVR